MAEPPTTLPPPYTSFSTFWAVVEELHQRGPAPQVLENDVLGGQGRGSGTLYELAHAFKSLGLMDGQRRTTALGQELIADPTPTTLRAIVEARYPDALALGLETASPGQLTKVLADMGMKEGTATIRKARSFFLQAAEKAGISVGPHLRTRAPAGSGQRRPRPSRPSGENGGAPTKKPDLVTRYVELLMDKVKEQDEPSVELLDRIERALNLAVSEPPKD